LSDRSGDDSFDIDIGGAFMEAERPGSAALFAAGHDGGVEALAETGGEIVNFVGAVDLDGLAGGVEGDFAVFAAAHVLLECGSGFGGYRVVDEVVKKG
jgi:hypothetical protein